MPDIRLTSPTVAFEYGGKLPRNTVVSVDPETARRWKKNGFAIDDDGQDLPAMEGDAASVDDLKAQRARLDAEIAAAEVRHRQERNLQQERASLRFPDPDEQDDGPFDLSDGRANLADASDEDGPGQATRRRRSRS